MAYGATGLFSLYSNWPEDSQLGCGTITDERKKREHNALYKVTIVNYEEGYDVMDIAIYDVRTPLTKMVATRELLWS